MCVQHYFAVSESKLSYILVLVQTHVYVFFFVCLFFQKEESFLIMSDSSKKNIRESMVCK